MSSPKCVFAFVMLREECKIEVGGERKNGIRDGLGRCDVVVGTSVITWQGVSFSDNNCD